MRKRYEVWEGTWQMRGGGREVGKLEGGLV